MKELDESNKGDSRFARQMKTNRKVHENWMGEWVCNGHNSTDQSHLQNIHRLSHPKIFLPVQALTVKRFSKSKKINLEVLALIKGRDQTTQIEVGLLSLEDM